MIFVWFDDVTSTMAVLAAIYNQLQKFIGEIETATNTSPRWVDILLFL